MHEYLVSGGPGFDQVVVKGTQVMSGLSRWADDRRSFQPESEPVRPEPAQQRLALLGFRRQPGHGR